MIETRYEGGNGSVIVSRENKIIDIHKYIMHEFLVKTKSEVSERLHVNPLERMKVLNRWNHARGACFKT